MLDSENKLVICYINIVVEFFNIYLVLDGLVLDDIILIEGLWRVLNGDEIEFEFILVSDILVELLLYVE